MEQALTTLVLETAAITDLIGERLTPGVRTQGGALPALVMNLFGAQRGYSHSGDDGLPRARVQFDAYGATYDEARLLAQAVTARLSGFAGVVGGVRLTILDATDEASFAHDTPDQTYRRSMDFTVWARAA